LKNKPSRSKKDTRRFHADRAKSGSEKRDCEEAKVGNIGSGNTREKSARLPPREKKAALLKRGKLLKGGVLKKKSFHRDSRNGTTFPGGGRGADQTRSVSVDTWRKSASNNRVSVGARNEGVAKGAPVGQRSIGGLVQSSSVPSSRTALDGQTQRVERARRGERTFWSWARYRFSKI